MRVGFDLDGVLYDFGNSVRAYLDSIGRAYGWKDDSHEPHHWDFYEYWGMDRTEFKQVCDDGADAGYVFCGPARDNAVESVRRVAEQGHTVVIITDRFFGSTPDVSHTNTLDWLWYNAFQYNEVHFSPNKLLVPTDTFVEDKLENYDALVAGGVDAFLINRAWNQVEGGDNRKRIDDVSDYADAIVEMTNQRRSEFSIA